MDGNPWVRLDTVKKCLITGESASMDKQQQIRGFIVENFLLSDGDSLTVTQSLLDSGVVDSTGVMELVMFLEDTFGIQVADDDLVPEKLDTIAAIAEFVDQKCAESKSGAVGSD